MRAAAQGGNVGMGGKEGDFESLAQRVANFEKKNDAFNVYLWPESFTDLLFFPRNLLVMNGHGFHIFPILSVDRAHSGVYLFL